MMLSRLLIGHLPFIHRWPPVGHGQAHRFFEKGVLKIVVLSLLQEEPGHGYDLIRRLEERSHGFYSPSAGSIYPLLQKLLDKELVTSRESEGRRVYSITEAGRVFMAERGEGLAQMKQMSEHRFHHFDKQKWQDSIDDITRLRQLFARYMGKMNDTQVSAIQNVVSRACRDIEEILEQSQAGKEEYDGR
ncbi:transcriptional regulator, PadR-like family [Dehalogenimonas lykanthroporepellens BL-DC-9]|nr:transcriptional regulator, PadR-like family [Dehalogenimonas lykanthroporepellens BL-DC-9]